MASSSCFSLSLKFFGFLTLGDNLTLLSLFILQGYYCCTLFCVVPLINIITPQNMYGKILLQKIFLPILSCALEVGLLLHLKEISFQVIFLFIIFHCLLGFVWSMYKTIKTRSNQVVYFVAIGSQTYGTSCSEEGN